MSNLPLPSEDNTFFCRQHSQLVEEQLFASVKKNRFWLLLEYPYPWGEKAFEDSNLPGSVKEHLANLLDRMPELKILLIKNQESLFSDTISFFVGISTEKSPILYKFQLDEYKNLLDIDLQSYLSSKQSRTGHRFSESIYLICTNGKRDRCCARFGLDIYNHLTAYQPEFVWQSSHVGGHRFAANMICFPHGIYYGRVTIDDAMTLTDSYRAGEILVDKYRGRACYDPVVQAAEYYLRAHTGERGISIYHHKETLNLDLDKWTVKFSSPQRAEDYQLDLRSESSKAPVFKSCIDDEAVPVTQFRLIDIKTSEVNFH